MSERVSREEAIEAIKTYLKIIFSPRYAAIGGLGHNSYARQLSDRMKRIISINNAWRHAMAVCTGWSGKELVELKDEVRNEELRNQRPQVVHRQ